MSSNKIAIIGAGFSGLTLAWALEKQGFEVEIFEARSTSGGMIQTTHQKVPAESAAHALLASADVEELASDLNIEFVPAGFISKSKWIFRGGPRKWPLTWKETLRSMGIPRRPRPSQTVEDWVLQHGSRELCDYVVEPALQGIYGATSSQLSASLVFSGFFNKKQKTPQGQWRGSVAPLNGMGELIQSLSKRFKIHYQSNTSIVDLQSAFQYVVVATNLHDAGLLLQNLKPSLSQDLLKLPRVSLQSATISYSGKSSRIRGFGCLFPQKENFESLGVLFNSDLFAKRGQNSETWIFRDHLDVSSPLLIKKIEQDRLRLDSTPINIDFCEIHRWPQSLPLYGVELEEFLKTYFPSRNFGSRVTDQIYLTGNYLGGLGLSKILNYNKRLAQVLKERVS